MIGTPCRCGSQRQTWQAFCPTCYAKLPAELTNAVRLRSGADGARALHEANTWLAQREAEQQAKRDRLTAR